MDKSGMSRRRAAASASGRPSYLERRAELLKIAAGVFRDRGFHRTTIRDVAEAAGTDRASLYYYFRTKEEIFREVVREAVLANAVGIEELTASDLGPEDKLRAAIVDLMRSYGEHHPFLYVFIQEDLGTLSGEVGDDWAKEIIGLSERYQQRFIGIIDEGQRAAAFRDDAPARVLAYAIIGMVSWTHRWFDPNGQMSPAQVGEVFASLALEGLKKDR